MLPLYYVDLTLVSSVLRLEMQRTFWLAVATYNNAICLVVIGARVILLKIQFPAVEKT
jgi:hypothetical protein